MVKRLGRLRGIISGVGLRPVPKVLSSVSCRHRAHNVATAILMIADPPVFSETDRRQTVNADRQRKNSGAVIRRVFVRVL
jgi:hypothetical protein